LNETVQDTKKKNTFLGFILAAVSMKDSDREEQIFRNKYNTMK